MLPNVGLHGLDVKYPALIVSNILDLTSRAERRRVIPLGAFFA